jgi:hypothetical protein
LRRRAADSAPFSSLATGRASSLNEEETEKLTWEEMIAYLNTVHKIDPRWLRNAFEESFIDPRINQLRFFGC